MKKFGVGVFEMFYLVSWGKSLASVEDAFEFLATARKCFQWDAMGVLSGMKSMIESGIALPEELGYIKEAINL